jgi:hypothetical protein
LEDYAKKTGLNESDYEPFREAPLFELLPLFNQMLWVKDKWGTDNTFHGGNKVHHGRLGKWDVPLKRT